MKSKRRGKFGKRKEKALIFAVLFATLAFSIVLVMTTSGIVVGAGTANNVSNCSSVNNISDSNVSLSSTTVQEAVDNASPGDMSVVYNGTYKENGVVNKSWKPGVQMNNSTGPVVPFGAYENQSGSPPEKYWAVIVGATSHYAYQDAEDMYNVLTRASDNWDANHIRFLVNESATKANIRDAIQWMANKASAEDTCLFYFSGHGNSTIDYSCDEADGFDETLCTFDDDIIDDELEEWIGELKAEKVVAILDACHSGGVLTPFQIGENTETYDLSGFAKDLEKADCLVIAGCRMNEEGYSLHELKNGVFTYYIVQGLWGAADKDDNGRITVRELCDYSFPKIVDYLEYPRQHPLLWPDDNTANNLILIKLKTSIPKKIKVPDEYRTIQEAVEAAMPGDAIEVSPGTYTENVIINKLLTINVPHGESIIHAAKASQSCIFVTMDNTSISGLICQNGSNGIQLWKSRNNIITNNNCSNNTCGFLLWSSNNNMLARNVASNNEHGIKLYKSRNNCITSSNCSNNLNGIYSVYSNENNISYNNCSYNLVGIGLEYSRSNKLIDNCHAQERDRYFWRFSN